MSDYDRALNSVLMSSGLQGRMDGNTLLVGTAVSAKYFGTADVQSISDESGGCCIRKLPI